MQASGGNNRIAINPLSLKETWPPTGPIYGITDRADPALAVRGFWQRLVGGTAVGAETASAAKAPVWC